MADARLRIPERIAPGDFIVVHSVLSHPMDCRFLRGAGGERADHPCWIEEAVVTYGGEEVARFEWNSAATRDPVVSFRLRADREAPITILWRDNHGGTFQKSVDVVFAC